MRKLLAVFAVACSGCAFTDVPVALPTSVATGLSGGDGRQVVIMRNVKDERSTPDKCGIQKNGYNMETAKATCSMEPAAWVSQILATELKAAGFDVVDESAAKASAMRIDGSVLQVFVEPVIGFSTISLETDIHLRLVATSKTGLLAERDFFVKGTESGLVARAGNFETSFDRASRQVVKDMVAAVISLMNRYPQLGLKAPVKFLTPIGKSFTTKSTKVTKESV